jgi:hypothetical protein
MMSLLESSPGLIQALCGEMTPKFLATRSATGVPNVVPVVSIQPSYLESDVLFFGNFLLRKSVRNLDEDPRVGVLVITQALEGWVLRGDFVEWQRSGPYVEQQMSSGLLRYNAYTGVRNAGIIRVRSVECSFVVSKLAVVRDYLLARLAARRIGSGPLKDGSGATPLPVQREFGRMAAVKVLAWIGGDGFPLLAPALSLQPASANRLACWQGNRALPAPASEATVAANVLTLDAISYQAKGQWQQQERSGVLSVQEVYAGGPPLPGHRIL